MTLLHIRHPWGPLPLAVLSFGCGGGVELQADADGDGFAADDCNDDDPNIHPEARELCDGLDQDCDGSTDELDQPLGFLDLDSDGYGGLASSECADVGRLVAEGGDCDDQDLAIHPGAAEICDSLGRDEDCDGLIDQADPNAVPQLWFTDADNDGFGDAGSEGVASCEAPAGGVADATDCDDDADDVHPGAADPCDGLDQNCDGAIDGDAPDAAEWFFDSDNDGWGDATVSATACAPPSGFVAETGDCDDTNPTIHPEAPEDCGAEDRNCDGDATADSVIGVYADDADGDGHGAAKGPFTCSPPYGFVDIVDDCDDANALVHPGANEDCASDIDEDCDGRADECWIPLEESDARYDGANAGDLVGASLDFVGDVDGDGREDLLLGAPGARDARGEIYLMSSASESTGALAEDALALVYGSTDAGQLGSSAHGAGDLDGDASADFLVAAQGTGAFYGLMGPVHGSMAASESDFALTAGDAAGGTAVLSSGDVDGDGLPDLLVTAPGAPTRDVIATGAAAVFLSPLSGDLGLASADLWLAGSSEPEALGTGGDLRGDLDGDGLHDLVLGAPYANIAKSSAAGRALVFYAPWADSADADADDADLKLAGAISGGNFGWRVCSSGDFDGDGAHDIAVVSRFGEGSGRVSIYVDLDDGAVDGVWSTIVGDSEDGGFGTTVDATDTNDDALSELLVGNPDSDGSTGGALLLGPMEGTLTLIDAWTEFTGESTGDRAGASVALSGDERASVAMGAAGIDASATDAGRAYRIEGGLWD